MDADAPRRTQTRASLVAAGHWTIKEAADAKIGRLIAQGGIDGVMCEASVVPGGADKSCQWAQRLTKGEAPVWLLTEHGAQLDREAVFAAGAADIISLPCLPLELARRVSLPLRVLRAEREVAVLKEQQRHLSLHDPLTGLINREHFLLACRRELSAVARHGLPLAACILDLDHDGALHLQMGMSAADALIMAVGQRLESQLRGDDTLSRLEGGRFCALLPQTPESTARQVAGRLKDSVKTMAVTAAGPITVSVGVAVALPGAGMTTDGLLAAAEARLLASRQASGRVRA